MKQCGLVKGLNQSRRGLRRKLQVTAEDRSSQLAQVSYVRSHDRGAYFIFIVFSPPPTPRLPEEGVHHQGVAHDAHGSDHQDEEGHGVVNVVLDVHRPVEAAIRVHVCAQQTRAQ